MRIRIARGVIVCTVVVLTLAAATGCSGKYRAVNDRSPVFSSSTHGFSIRFPGKPSVHTFDNGDIDVSYRTGVSDYSVIASTTEEVPTGDQIQDAYDEALDKVGNTVGAHATNRIATTIDGLVAAHAVVIGGHVKAPWEYSIVFCGANVYQFNTYGVRPTDTQKFLDGMHIVGKTAQGCD
jgi:hypothetical protein